MSIENSLSYLPVEWRDRSLVFYVPGEPVAKGRPRIGKNRYTGRPVNVTPEKTVRFESLARHEAWLAMRASGRSILQAGVRLEVDAYFGAPAKWKSQRAIPKTTKPDGSNVAKAVEDALNGVVYVDDARVAELVVRKWWQSAGEDPCTRVKVESIDGEWV